MVSQNQHNCDNNDDKLVLTVTQEFDRFKQSYGFTIMNTQFGTFHIFTL
jgi:hypothetical protein